MDQSPASFTLSKDMNGEDLPGEEPSPYNAQLSLPNHHPRILVGKLQLVLIPASLMHPRLPSYLPVYNRSSRNVGLYPTSLTGSDHCLQSLSLPRCIKRPFMFVWKSQRRSGSPQHRQHQHQHQSSPSAQYLPNFILQHAFSHSDRRGCGPPFSGRWQSLQAGLHCSPDRASPRFLDFWPCPDGQDLYEIQKGDATGCFKCCCHLRWNSCCGPHPIRLGIS